MLSDRLIELVETQADALTRSKLNAKESSKSDAAPAGECLLKTSFWAAGEWLR